MISRRYLSELAGLRRAEENLPLRPVPEYASLVIPNGNSNRAAHQWFKYKEAFSADLLHHVLAQIDAASPPSGERRLLDPFCGVGTSLLSAQLRPENEQRIDAVGIECNPFSAFVARTKVAWPKMKPEVMRSLTTQILRESAIRTNLSLPELSSIRSGRCISIYMARQILRVRDALMAASPSAERDALLLGLAATIEPVSKIRRDGRALRIVAKPRTVFLNELSLRWAGIIADVETLRRGYPSASLPDVKEGDGREPRASGIQDESIDLVLTSPPYPNNIDYNEVYKLELWLLGFTHSSEEFLDLRRQTFRSHPTCRPAEDEPTFQSEFLKIIANPEISDVLGVVLRRVSKIERTSKRGRSKVLLGYAYDLWRSLKAHYAALRVGGHGVYVVGNSLHGGVQKPYLIATDILLAEFAKLIGFEVVEIMIARPLQRRLAGNHFLRDSVIVLRRP